MKDGDLYWMLFSFIFWYTRVNGTETSLGLCLPPDSRRSWMQHWDINAWHEVGIVPFEDAKDRGLLHLHEALLVFAYLVFMQCFCAAFFILWYCDHYDPKSQHSLFNTVCEPPPPPQQCVRYPVCLAWCKAMWGCIMLPVQQTQMQITLFNL